MMKVLLIFGTLCTSFLGGHGVPVPTFTGTSSVSVIQPGVQYSTFVQHHPLVHLRFQPVQTNFVQLQFQPQPLLRPLGYHYPPLLLVQPIQLIPSNATVPEQKPDTATSSPDNVKPEAPTQDYPDAVQPEVDTGAEPAVLPLMKSDGDFDLDGLEKDGKTRAELEANEQEGDTVAVEAADSTGGVDNDAEDE